MERKGRNVLCKGEGQRPIEPEQRSLQGENLTLKPLVVGGGAGSENSGSWSTGAETGRDGKEKRRKKRQKEGERGKQNKQRKRGDGKRLGKEGTGKQRKERRGKEEKRGGPGRQISYLRENPPSAGLQKTPRPGHSSLLLPLTAPSPSACLARLRWFPCGRFIFKNADAVPPPGPHTVATGASAKPKDPTQPWGGKEG